MANESKEDKTLKSLDSNGHQSSTLMKRIVEVSRKSSDDDTEIEVVADREDDSDVETEADTEVETNEDYQGQTGKHNGQGESDEIDFIDKESEVGDGGSTTSTTKKPYIVSFWPR